MAKSASKNGATSNNGGSGKKKGGAPGGDKHWTKQPENKERLRQMRIAQAARAAERRAAASNGTIPAQVSPYGKLRKDITALAVRGAMAEIKELEARLTTLRLFVNTAGKDDGGQTSQP